MNLRVVSRTFNSKDTSHLGTCAAMSGAQETEAQAAGSGATGIGNSMVPWHQIPRFEPGVTDVRVYSRKLEFLRAIWPEEHLEHLAPRAALMVEGVAFQKVSRLDATKLKSKDGVKILVEALGGQWGMLQDEEKYNLFEKALYQVKQQPEESTDNYLARHDIAFEDIISAGVTMEEIRAYILLRQSTLNADDRKRIIVDNKGRLNYEEARKSLRLLGSRFFQEVQHGVVGKRTKTQEIHEVEEEEALVAQFEDTNAPEIDEEIHFQMLLDEGDEHAQFCHDFEEQILNVCQEHPDLSACFNTYQEARQKMREKARNRGFWPAQKGKGKFSKGKGKGQKSGNAINAFRRKSLAERIASSTCRRCLQPGHWKRECPNPPHPSYQPNRGAEQRETISMTEIGEDHGTSQTMEIYAVLPSDAQDFHLGDLEVSGPFQQSFQQYEECFALFPGNPFSKSFQEQLALKLQACCRTLDSRKSLTPAARPEKDESIFQAPERNSGAEPLFVASQEEGPQIALVDTGASRTVIGTNRLKRLVGVLGDEVVSRMKKVATKGVTFKFGNSGTLQSDFAILLPRKDGGWLKVEVIPGNTPFLISNSFLKKTGGVVDPRRNQLLFREGQVKVPLVDCRKELSGVDVSRLLEVDLGNAEDVLYTKERFETKTNRQLTDRPHISDSLTKQNGKDTVAIVSSNNQQKQNQFDRSDPRDGAPILHARAPQLGGGPESCRSQEDSPRSRDIEQTSRHRDSRAVGRMKDPKWQVARKDVPRGILRAATVHPSDHQSQGSGILASKSTDVCPYQTEARRWATGGKQNSPDHRPNSHLSISQESGGTRSHGGEECEGRQGQGGGTRLRGSAEDDQEGLRDGSDRIHDGSSIDHAGRKQSREGATAQGEDRYFTERSRTRTGSTGAQQSSKIHGIKGASLEEAEIDATVKYIEAESYERLLPAEEHCLHQEVNRMIGNIEDGLSQTLLMNPVPFFEPSQESLKAENTDRGIDILEVYCDTQSQLTKQVIKAGGTAVRFSREDGDLNTEEGISALWQWIQWYEPRHIWVAPECKLWGMFSRYNMSKSLKMFDRISEERKHNLHHLKLCNDLYLHQMSYNRHFHLEQPVGSEMMEQPELWDAAQGTLAATFDMCRVGDLHLPHETERIQKCTRVYTTCRRLFNNLHGRRCNKQHQHRHIAGTVRLENQTRSVSQLVQSYTPLFGKRIAGVLVGESWFPEQPLILDEMILGLEEHERPEIAQESMQLQKRRRVQLKQPEESLYGQVPSWETVFRKVGTRTPRVGNFYFRRGEDGLVDVVQRLVPEFKVQLMISCRGTERHRLGGLDPDGNPYPWRKTILVDRNTGEIRETGPAERWLELSQRQKIRGTGPAKISLTLFGQDLTSAASAVPSESEQSLPAPMNDPRMEVEAPLEPQPEDLPLKVPTSGPDFLSLEAKDQVEVRRLHNNLGHPDPVRFSRFLRERGARDEIVRGAMDMHCDTCLETQNRPKLPHPGHIHSDLDFNDIVGADGAYWTNSAGKMFHFMHYIDEGTLFHVGCPTGRTTREQVRAFETTWLNWAGPCRMLYLDPAGEYRNDDWIQFLQREGIAVSMTAAESHWQLGRCESHGGIIKGMLSRMDLDNPITTPEEFARSLRHAFDAKNSLSRVNGFTPEQALLGKSKMLPGSIVGDEQATSHVMADSNTPEGVKFRESLARRESARRAFVKADNDSAFRRALLRRSRPGHIQVETGDWVLYWRKTPTTNRVDRGHWRGPAQVISVEAGKVVWLSHAGRIIRASPQQLRPASLREYLRLPRDDSGRVVDERPRDDRYVVLDEDPPVEELPPPLNIDQQEESYSPSILEQPEVERFPSDNQQREREPQTEAEEGVPLDGVEVHVPSDDDGLFVEFGDESCFGLEEGVWELSLDDTFVLDTECADDLCSHPEIFDLLVVNSAKKQRVEVDYHRLGEDDRKLFDAAKDKEIKAWLDHGTVKKLAKGTLSPEKVMRCRWILTWKDPMPGMTQKRAKARLVVLGFEDPSISLVSTDAPTLSKDGRQLILQQVASRGWSLINFDISTAFLKGKSDDRELGIHAPKELRRALQMSSEDQCGLLGGAYGRVDAPQLWYKSLRTTLESLGFVACPFDNCVFSLVSPNKQGEPQVHGIIGIHVDDGIGGGDGYFRATIERLRQIYSFGVFNEKSFEFCGISFKQDANGAIEMNQSKYISRISPINVPRERRLEPKAPVTELERQQLRQLCGSLQYAAVHTRPDICAKVGILSSKINRAVIEDLLQANRVLYEAKSHPVELTIVPIPESRLTFCAFSDASFATNKNETSRQGTLIVSTDCQLSRNESAVVCPMAWSSKKIPRVVTSTLSAEAIALSSSLDRLGYLRVCWEWFKNPGLDWTDISEVLGKAPLANIVTDCKSVYDVSTKNSPPTCTEYRTTLECLSVKQRLRENVTLRWISSNAMLADSLTKCMSGDVLRAALKTGAYRLFDEGNALRERANRRERLKWLQETASMKHDATTAS